MDLPSKSFIALHEKQSQENLGCLIEIIGQFQMYRNRAHFDEKRVVSIEIGNWQLHIAALLNIATAIAGDLKVSHNIIKLLTVNQNVGQMLSQSQVDQAVRELQIQLKTK